MVSNKSFIEVLDREMRAAADADKVSQMRAYMKDQFPFMGVMATPRKQAMRKAIKEAGGLEIEGVPGLVQTLWERPEREYQYVAIDILERFQKKYPEGWMEWIPDLIIDRSWWDTVDALASNVVGFYLLKYPHRISDTVDRWIGDEHLWLRRTALLHQLKWKGKTDTKRLFNYIRLTAHEQEFFIAKAIGWALREYSKTDSAAVKRFIESEELQPLSVREGSKYLK